MKLECTVEKLKIALEFVATTVSKQAISPLLQNIYIEVNGHNVLFRSHLLIHQVKYEYL
jgi:DNA polymerase III sliding clamp (beta) subunit (PCNA family)